MTVTVIRLVFLTSVAFAWLSDQSIHGQPMGLDPFNTLAQQLENNGKSKEEVRNYIDAIFNLNDAASNDQIPDSDDFNQESINVEEHVKKRSRVCPFKICPLNRYG